MDVLYDLEQCKFHDGLLHHDSVVELEGCSFGWLIFHPQAYLPIYFWELVLVLLHQFRHCIDSLDPFRCHQQRYHQLDELGFGLLEML